MMGGKKEKELFCTTVLVNRITNGLVEEFPYELVGP